MGNAWSKIRRLVLLNRRQDIYIFLSKLCELVIVHSWKFNIDFRDRWVGLLSTPHRLIVTRLECWPKNIDNNFAQLLIQVVAFRRSWKRISKSNDILVSRWVTNKTKLLHLKWEPFSKPRMHYDMASCCEPVDNCGLKSKAQGGKHRQCADPAEKIPWFQTIAQHLNVCTHFGYTMMPLRPPSQ